MRQEPLLEKQSRCLRPAPHLGLLEAFLSTVRTSASELTAGFPLHRQETQKRKKGQQCEDIINIRKIQSNPVVMSSSNDRQKYKHVHILAYLIERKKYYSY